MHIRPSFHDCEPRDIRFLLLLKSILVFESGNQEEAIARVGYLAKRQTMTTTKGLPTFVPGACKGPSSKGRTMSFPKDDLARRYLGGVSMAWTPLLSNVYVKPSMLKNVQKEALEILLNIIKTSDEEILGSKTTVAWIADFTEKCMMTLDPVDDGAFGSVKHDHAVTQYSTALPFSRLFVMRSRARAAKGLWKDALQDANEACVASFLCDSGYEAKHVVLHAVKQYDEAIDAFKSMLLVMERSDDSAIKQLRKNYVPPSETIAAIDHIVRAALESCPLVVIDVVTGYLCDGPERIHIFKASPTFKELVSSMTRELDNKRIRRVVASFFGYVMFSHAWQGNEPLYQDVKEAKSVWDLPDTPLNERLRNFCKESRRLGHNWAWSDTCCIDKTTSSILNQSLTSMYKWYADSAATIVFLADVAHPSKLGDLSPANRKKSQDIMQELADAINIPRGTIITFSPDDLGVCEKLRLASTRNATVNEDVAYSLIGIFKSDIRPHYGEGADALGHLLEEIVARFGEVTVLAWSGKSSSYNSSKLLTTLRHSEGKKWELASRNYVAS
ncbi:hypothetical protein EDC04DRAFT_3089926 [Pisolithus marmoratus]|nr:hypothetical protein EDC04DRAFT_3089926 [Pisolithus marmoratus]